MVVVYPPLCPSPTPSTSSLGAVLTMGNMDCPAQGWRLSLMLELGAGGDAQQIYGKEEEFQKS